jgi:hypothetical protein
LAASLTYRPWLQIMERRDLPSGTSAATEELQAAYGQLPLSDGITIHAIKQSSSWRGVTAISLCRHGHSM